MSQKDGSGVKVLATKPDGLSSIPRAQVVNKRNNFLLCSDFYIPTTVYVCACTCYTHTHTHTHAHTYKVSKCNKKIHFKKFKIKGLE